MGLLLTCPCRHSYEAKENLSGRLVRCHHCGRVLQLPGLPWGCPVSPVGSPEAAPGSGAPGPAAATANPYLRLPFDCDNVTSPNVMNTKAVPAGPRNAPCASHRWQAKAVNSHASSSLHCSLRVVRAGMPCCSP